MSSPRHQLQLISLAMAVVIASPTLTNAQAEQASEASVIALVEQLADPQFAVRSAATEDLIAAEGRSIAAVTEALRVSKDLEVQTRCVDILAALARSQDSDVAAAASLAVDQVAADPAAAGLRRARQLQGQLVRARRLDAISYLRAQGAILTSQDQTNLIWGNRVWGNPLIPGGGPAELEPMDEPMGGLFLDENWQGKATDLARLSYLPEITDVILDHPQLGTAELKYIAVLPNVTHLVLRNVKVSDEDLALFAKLPQLATLSFLYVPITDAGVANLESWKNLRWLALVGTDVTEDRVTLLRQKRSEDLVVEHKSGAFLGISPGTLDPVSPDQGLPLDKVTPGGAADRAGLVAGDLLLTFDGSPVSSFDELKERIGSKLAGETIDLKIRRGDQEMPLKVILGKWSCSDWWNNNNPHRLDPVLVNPVPIFVPMPAPEKP